MSGENASSFANVKEPRSPFQPSIKLIQENIRVFMGICSDQELKQFHLDQISIAEAEQMRRSMPMEVRTAYTIGAEQQGIERLKQLDGDDLKAAMEAIAAMNLRDWGISFF